MSVSKLLREAIFCGNESEGQATSVDVGVGGYISRCQ